MTRDGSNDKVQNWGCVGERAWTSVANAASLSVLSLRCARQGGDSCSKLEKGLERCKKTAECVASLSPLPDPVLAEISADQSIDQAIRGHADSILGNRKL